MSLDVRRLEKVRELADGVVQARCPACAEGGGDRKGEHLRVYPDGRFGCCVHPKDREHRRRIHALTGDKAPRVIKVRVAAGKSGGEVVGGILGRLGRAFGNPKSEIRSPKGELSGSDASDGVREVQNGEWGVRNEARTPRTGVSQSSQVAADNSRTLRTSLNPNGYEEVFFGDEKEESCTYKEFAPPVRSVRETEAQPEAEPGSDGGVRSVREAVEAAVEPPKVAEPGVRMPYFDTDGTLRIPFNSPERYHWWKPPHDQRLRVKEIIAELRARQQEVDNGTDF
ncbi:MAG TPA: hypothetical protein P5205_19565 [Candidatus Paceibacterota bacterium]|nr:hypothetical protein [Verrucomicrobiota bacterium]HSA12564.1 hypothetical protein [Candidatus Paceibacterota bacterium]